MPTRFDFILGEERLGIKGFTGFETNRAFNSLLQTNGHEPDALSYSLTPLVKEESMTKFSVYSSDIKLREKILEIMLDGESYTLRFLDKDIPLVKISVENSKVSPPLMEVGSSYRLRFTTPVVLGSRHFPTLEDMYLALISIYSQMGGGVDIDEFVKSSVAGISTPHFKLKSSRYHDGGRKITGFRGTILFVVEDTQGLEDLPVALDLASAFGIGEYTNLGFGRVNISLGGKKK